MPPHVLHGSAARSLRYKKTPVEELRASDVSYEEMETCTHLFFLIDVKLDGFEQL